MARAEFQAFTQSLLVNYRRVAARAEPPLARCLEVKRVEPGSLAAKVLLAPGDLLVSINGQSAGVLDPKLWRLRARLREYIFYSPQTRERVEWTAPGIDPGCELRRTPELIKATYKPESRNPEPLMELWEAGAWPDLLRLAGDALRGGPQDSPFLPLHGAALYETGRIEEGMSALALFVRDFARGWTVDYRGLCSYYFGLEKKRQGETDTAAQVLAMAYADLSVDRIADAIVDLGVPRPSPAILWTGQTAPGDYELQTLEGAPETVTMSEALLALKEGHILLLCLLSSYRANGPYNELLRRYQALVRDFTPFVGPLHVITEIKERYPDRPHYFETEDKVRADGAPLKLLFDPDGQVSRMYGPRVSPFVMALDQRGLVLCEGEMEGMEVWRALVAANR